MVLLLFIYAALGDMADLFRRVVVFIKQGNGGRI
jgi:hypothetical protein